MNNGIRVSDKLIRLVGQNLYSTSPIFPVTVRELLQNSIDAQKAKGIDTPILFTVIIDPKNSMTSLICEDAGIGMDQTVINEKFLVIGESGKDQGVGGFGIAKAAIILSCDSWSLLTQNNKYTGSNITVNSEPTMEVLEGCKIQLNYDNYKNNRLYPYNHSYNQAIAYLITSDAKSAITFQNLAGNDSANAQISVTGLKVNNKTLLEKLEIGCNTIEIHCVPAINHQFISVFGQFLTATDNQLMGRTIYRLNGLTQFIEYGYSGAKFNLVVEISTTARPDNENYPFTLSREEVSDEIQSELSNKLRNYFNNERSTIIKLKEANGDKIKYQECYDGGLHSGESTKLTKTEKKLATQKAQDKVIEQEISALVTTPIVDRLNTVQTRQNHNDTNADTTPTPIADLLEMSPLGIKTLIERTPETLKINIKANKYIKLLQVWTELIALIMSASPDYQHSFGIGLALDDDYVALRKRHDDVIYYLFNPADLKVSDPMTTVTRLLFAACHEVAHTHYSNHNESFVVAHGQIMNNFLKEHGMQALYEIARVLRDKS